MQLSIYEKDRLVQLFNSKYNYICRCMSGRVLAFKSKPILENGEWEYEQLSEFSDVIELDNNQFGFLIYEHKPWKISDLLNQTMLNKYVRGDGVIVYRKIKNSIEILLSHPGGPYYRNKNLDSWSVIKGEQDHNEDDETVAKREFYEETGASIDDSKLVIFHGNGFCVHSNKFVNIFALEKDLDETVMKSNLCEVEFPPNSGITIDIPENDSYKWFAIEEAADYVFPSQKQLLKNFASWVKGDNYE